MRVVQHRILTKLLDFANIPNYIYAFEKNKSIPSMAQIHVEKALVVSIDLKDFFHSITQKQLLEIFIRMGIGDPAARTLSEICTYKYFVPQGALTSPKIANIITTHTFGESVKEYCRSNNLDVTIYADDITISTNNLEVSAQQIIQSISAFIKTAGFRVNHEKTKIMRSSRRQYVCGVVVNKKTNLMRKERNRLRAIVHNVIKNGVEEEAKKTGSVPEVFLNQLRGKINWYRQLNRDQGGKLFDKLALFESEDVENRDFANIMEPLSIIEEGVSAPSNDLVPW